MGADMHFLAKGQRANRFTLVLACIAAVTLSIPATTMADLDPNAPPLPGVMPLPATPIAVGASVGSLPGSWDVSPAGQFTYSIPLDVPTGRAGMQPSLSLQYSSGAGNGLLGVGWWLSGLSSITRCAKSLASDGIVDGIDYGEDPDTTPDKFCFDGNK